MVISENFLINTKTSAFAEVFVLRETGLEPVRSQ